MVRKRYAGVDRISTDGWRQVQIDESADAYRKRGFAVHVGHNYIEVRAMNPSPEIQVKLSKFSIRSGFRLGTGSEDS